MFRSDERATLLRGAAAVADTGRAALEHAVSVAGTLLLTEATMTEIPDRQYPATGVPGGAGLD